MPHIQLDINRKLSSDKKKILCKCISDIFSSVMRTGRDHIGISIREFDEDNLYLGQAINGSAGLILVNIDLRSGRTVLQRKKFKIEIMLRLSQITSIPIENMYVVYTEHPGDDFHLSDRNLEDWHL